MTPSPRADKRTLIRRATIDLWGIPPTADEVDAFEARPGARRIRPAGRSPAGLAALRRALGPALARRRPLRRHQGLRLHPGSPLSVRLHLPRLRDQRVQRRPAYDQFIVAAARRRPAPSRRRQPAAGGLGFLTVGRRFLLDQNEIIDDRIDVVSRGLLGLTVTCARCHDHKFDPIPTEDYYSLYGVFASSVEPAELPLLGRPGAARPSRPTTSESWRRRESTRRLPGGAARRIHGRLASAALRSTSRPLTTWISIRATAELDERGLADKLNTRRLRVVITLWKRYLDGDQQGARPGPGPWHAVRRPCRKDQFAARAAEVQRKLTTVQGRQGARRSIRWSPGRARQSAREHGRGRRAIHESLRPARDAMERARRRSRRRRARCPSPSGSRSARRCSAPNGPLACVAGRDARVSRSRASAASSIS